MSNNKNEPAYPYFPDDCTPYSGLTKREQLAAIALQGMLSNPKYYGPSEIDLAIDAVAFADALLFELEKPQQ